MTTSIATTNSDQQHLSVFLHDLMKPLHYTKVSNLRSRFETFCRNANLSENQKSYKTTTYIEPVNGKIVSTCVMSKAVAAAFCTYCNPAFGIQMTEALLKPQLDPYADLRKISIPEQWVYEGFPGRKCGSLHKTMMEGYHRSRGTPLHDQVVYDGGTLRFSPMFLLSIQFAKQDGFAFKAFVCSVLGTDALPAPETILTISFDGDALGVIV